tara:strand:+ start:139 stop:1098 length:960 start_codon:yes stop_codon:yes gene_type:complete
MKLKNKFAIGCLVQWYEIEIIEEYVESLRQALSVIENKENVIVDFKLVINQDLEKLDESQITMDKIITRFEKIIDGFELDVTEELVTIADYRRWFNDYYCDKVDVLMWGETDSLIPKQNFQVLDLLHTNNVSQKIHKYLAFFGTNKMWDEGWKPLEHPDFTDKPHTDGDFDNWWSLCYTMNLKEMNEFNDKVEELDVRVVNPYKFNGCGLVISSDVIKAGVNIPKSAFFIHEDTAFMHSLIKVFDGSIPQFIIKNVLLVHNRKHPNKRKYVKDEIGDTPSQQRESTEWYNKAWKYSHHNVYTMYGQEQIYNWEDVFKNE